MNRRVRVLGVSFDPIEAATALEHAADWIAARRRPAAIIVHANVHSCVTSLDDPLYKQAVDEADLAVPDGMPLVWIARGRGYPVRRRVYGPDFVLALAALGARRGWRAFLYGGADGVARNLADRLEREFPGLTIVGCHAPPFRALTPEEDAVDCEMINASRPDIVWVSLGGPRQDRWMADHRDRLDASVLHGVGAAFDFLTGRVRQAPGWVRDLGFEWAYRLYREPRRLWRRYLIGNARFVVRVVPDLVRRRDDTPGDN